MVAWKDRYKTNINESVSLKKSDIKNILSIKGKYEIKDNGKIKAKIFDREVFFKNLKVNWDKNFPFSVEIFGMAAQCKTLEECFDLLEKESEGEISFN